MISLSILFAVEVDGREGLFEALADIPRGITGIDERGLALNVVNSNNHQTTWGVLGAALTALEDYMQSMDKWGTAEFTIFDGTNEVGKGTLK